MNLKGKKVLVTGAGGFIGSHLVEALAARGARVRAMVRYNSKGSRGLLEIVPEKKLRGVEFVAGDIQDPLMVKKAVAGCDVVFHLAALIGIPYSYMAPSSYVMTNVLGTMNVMQGCLEAGVKKIVHTSTSETYGTARYVPMDEAHPLVGQSPYSASKIGADKIAESFNLSFGLPVATIRPFNTFGERQSARAVIPSVISQAINSRAIKLGSLEPERDFTYVSDMAEAFLRVAEVDESVGEVINVGTGKGISVESIVERALRITGKGKSVVREEKRVRPRDSEVMRLVCNSAKAERILGWKPRFSFDEGLRRVFEFIKENPDLYHPEEYGV